MFLNSLRNSCSFNDKEFVDHACKGITQLEK